MAFRKTNPFLKTNPIMKNEAILVNLPPNKTGHCPAKRTHFGTRHPERSEGSVKLSMPQAFRNFDFCILIFDMIYKTNPIVTKQPHFQAKNALSQNEPISLC